MAVSTTTNSTKVIEHAPIVVGVFWAVFTAAIWGGWPAFTRLSVTQGLTPEDLVALRYAVGGLILLPVLIQQARFIPRRGWYEGVVLAFFQGAPLALLVTIGVRFAPASHMGALSPGLLPLFAAVLSVIFFKESLSVSRAVGLGMILVGALVIVGTSMSDLSEDFWKGDLMFITAGFMGSIYTLRMKRSGLTALQGAALMGVYSLIFYAPLYGWFWLGSSRLAEAPVRELIFQAFYQGVLLGAVTLFSLSQAIVILGAARAAAFLSLVPVLAAVFGAAVLREIPSAAETIAIVVISLGLLLAAGALRRQGKAARVQPMPSAEAGQLRVDR
jgi:drug/metabolite transporter (DMT)-like permease